MNTTVKRNPVSLKALAENKAEGVGKVTYFAVDPHKVEVEPGFNREISREHIESIKITLRAGGKLDPIWVRVDDGRIILVDGEHRWTATLECLADGTLTAPPDGYRMDAQQFRGTDAERVAHLLTSSQGLPLTPLQRGIQYRKLEAFGWTHKQIAEKVGRTTTHVAEVIMLASSNTDVQQMVKSNEVAAHLAVKAVRKHGENAGAVLAEAVQSARLAGKDKATAKDVDGATPKNLPQAIQIEKDSGGTFRAEILCPKYADLIAYLRGTDKTPPAAGQAAPAGEQTEQAAA